MDSLGPAQPDPRSASSIISLRGVTFRYPRALAPALRYVSLEVGEGERMLLVGPTGSGKSTLLRLLIGVVPHLTPGDLVGEAEVLGLDVRTTPPHALAARGVALVAQDPAETFVAERVGAEVAFGPEGLALPPAEIDARAGEALAAVGLGGFERRRVRELSGGEQQRVALAAALAMRPRLLLLDEPTAHLDEATARGILRSIDAVARDRGMSLVIVEHRLGIVARMATHALVIAAGTVARTGDPRSVLADVRVAELGVPVPRSTLAATALRLGEPVPLAPEELAARIDPGGAASIPAPASRSDTTALRFVAVGYTYPSSDRAAVRDVTFTVVQGERVALVGPTGSGKSTVAKLALGLRRPDAGAVELSGMPTVGTPMGELATAGGLVLQDPVRQLLAETVEDEIRLGLGHLVPSDARTRIDDALTRFALGDLRRRHPLTLSEGERRRVVLAAAVARRPAVLVLDEPTLGQDTHQRDALVHVVVELAASGTAVLVISHDPEFVNDACERVLVMREGALAADLPLGGDPRTIAAVASAGVPLADVPATVCLMAERGATVAARSLDELVDRVRPREVRS